MDDYFLEYKGRQYPTDVQGFLKKRLSWSTELGQHIAALDNVRLTEEHWEVINYFREYYEDYNICLLYTSPSPRDQRGSRMPSSA